MRPIRHMKKVVMVSALLLILTLSLGGGVASKGNDTAATYENLRLFTEVLSIVQNQYVDEVPPKDLIYNAIKGTLRGLDPHSSFLDPDSFLFGWYHNAEPRNQSHINDPALGDMLVGMDNAELGVATNELR